MDYKECFIVKDMFNSGWGYHLDPNDKKAIERDRERAQSIKESLPLYFMVTLPAHLGGYKFKPKGMSWEEYNRTIAAKEPTTEHMSMTFFRVKDYVPLSRTVGFFTAPKSILPSLKLETLDGKIIEGYSEYVKDGKQYVVLSDAVLNEVNKNFVHPKLNIKNFTTFSKSYVVGEESYTKYFETFMPTKQQAAKAYGLWKEGRQSLKEHFDYCFEKIAQNRREEEAAQQRRTAQQNRYESQFEKDFGGW